MLSSILYTNLTIIKLGKTRSIGLEKREVLRSFAGAASRRLQLTRVGDVGGTARWTTSWNGANGWRLLCSSDGLLVTVSRPVKLDLLAHVAVASMLFGS